MTQEQLQETLKTASCKVPLGIYAIRTGTDYYELKQAPFESKTQLKKTRNEYRRRGMKVFCNGI